MIPATTLGRQPARKITWQQELASAISEPEALARAVGLDPALFPASGQASDRFRLRGLDNVRAELNLIATAHNLRRMHTLAQAR